MIAQLKLMLKFHFHVAYFIYGNSMYINAGQFDDATVDQDKHSATGTMVASHASPIEGNKSNIEAAQTHTATTTSDSSFRPTTPEFSPPTTRLNPSAPVFSPTSSSSALSSPTSTTNTKLNPTTPEFSPITGMNGGVNTTTSHSNTQYSTLKTITAVTNKHSTTLNPRTGEFIPKISPIYMYSTVSANSSLNASAPAFVPTESHPSDMQNGQLGIDEQELPIPRPAPTVHDGFDEEEPLSLTPGDIISGFERPVKQTGDVGSESLLKATAEVLIKATMYPGSFDRGKMKLEHTVNAWTPTEGILANLAEMLIHWVNIMQTHIHLQTSITYIMCTTCLSVEDETHENCIIHTLNFACTTYTEHITSTHMLVYTIYTHVSFIHMYILSGYHGV